MPPIIYKDVVQGTSEWAELRCGIPTASQFHRIVTRNGKISKQAEIYMYELIAERMTGVPAVGYTSHWMDRGSALEAEAFNYYSFLLDVEPEKVGFVMNEQRSAGASPDALVDADGLLEIKVGKPSTHIGLLLRSGEAYEQHRVQAQGQLWVCEREWNDLLAYNPALPPALYRAARDEKFISMLASAVFKFCEVLEAAYQSIISRGFKRLTREAPSLTDLLRESLIALSEQQQKQLPERTEEWPQESTE